MKLFGKSVHWTGLRILAALVLALGLWGTGSFLTDLVAKADQPQLARPNPVVENEQRRNASSLDNQIRDYRGNLAAVVGFSVFIVAVTVHFAGLVWRTFSRTPLASVVAGLFLGASGFSGLLAATAVRRVNEFAFQAAGARAGEVTWLEDGMAFLNQIHLIFVNGWLILLGLGWLALALGVLRIPERLLQAGAALLLIGGASILASVGARFWLPTYGRTAPGPLLFVSDEFFSLGIVLGLVGSGLLSWLLEDGHAPASG